jgi:hypothetical protein
MSLVKCADCGSEISTAAVTCPHCGRPRVVAEQFDRRPGSGKVLAIILAGLVALMLFMCSHQTTPSGQGSSSSTSQATPNPTLHAGQSVTPEAIAQKYGAPDVIDSTEYDNPRPPMVTSFLVYKHEHVRFALLADAPIGAPPPYRQWKLLGAQDPRDKSVLSWDEVEKRMAGRASKGAEGVQHLSAVPPQSVVLTRVSRDHYKAEDGTLIVTNGCRETAAKAPATLEYNPQLEISNKLTFPSGRSCIVEAMKR